MFGTKTECACGCGRVLRGQARAFAARASDVAHLVDGLEKVVAPCTPDDAPQRRTLSDTVAGGRLIEYQLYATAHGEAEIPSVSVHHIDSWMATATQLMSSQARLMAADGIDPAAATGWAPERAR
jgi:hypothetical protein